MANDKGEFVPRDQVYSSDRYLCPRIPGPELVASRFGLFLARRFLFKQILNLNLTFAVCRKRHF